MAGAKREQEFIDLDNDEVQFWKSGLLACRVCDEVYWCVHRQHYLVQRKDTEYFWAYVRRSISNKNDYILIEVPLLPRQLVTPKVRMTPVAGSVENGLTVRLETQTAFTIQTIGIMSPDADSFVSLRMFLIDWIKDEQAKSDGPLVPCPSDFHQSSEAKMFEKNVSHMGDNTQFEYNTRVLTQGGCLKCQEIAESVGVEVLDIETHKITAAKIGSGSITSSGRISSGSPHGGGSPHGSSVGIDVSAATDSFKKAFEGLRRDLATVSTRAAGKTAALSEAAKRAEAAAKEALESEMKGLTVVEAKSSRPDVTPRMSINGDMIEEPPPF